MDDAKKKGKQNEEDQPSLDLTLAITIAPPLPSDPPSIDLNLPASSTDQPPPPPPHSSVFSTSQSSSSTEPELIQDSKRLKLTLDQEKNQDSSTAAQPLPFQIASHRRSYSPRSGRPPRPAQLKIGLPATSGPIDSAQQQIKQDLSPAQILLQVRDERARANFKLARQKAKKGRVDLVGPLMLTRTRPGLSPLGPGHLAPHDMVKQGLSDVMEFLNRFLVVKNISKKSQAPHSALTTPTPPPAQSLSAHATSSSASLPSDQIQPTAAPPLALSTLSSAPTVEQVIRILDEYVDSIPKTASAQEMEDRLQEFQIRIKVDPLPSWYALMRKSSLNFFDNLTEHFVCEALDSDPEDDNNDDDDDQAEKDRIGSGSSCAIPA